MVAKYISKFSCSSALTIRNKSGVYLCPDSRQLCVGLLLVSRKLSKETLCTGEGVLYKEDNGIEIFCSLLYKWRKTGKLRNWRIDELDKPGSNM